MDRELTIVEHLNELRRRIIISLVGWGLATVVSLPFSHHILKILKLPADGFIKTLAFFSPQEAFLVYLRIAFIFGFMLALPVVLYEIWAFVSLAIEERFKKYIIDFIVWLSLAFILGVFFSYFVLLPSALRFLLSFAKADLEPVISAQSYISFVLMLILGCGFVFEMPVLSFIFTKIGLINATFLRKKVKYAILIIFIVAAMLTPTVDAFNMLVFALPMLILYVVSIWVASWVK
jgi:sec-independent protein translocase protein TatC